MVQIPEALSEALTRKVADLARLELTDEEAETFTRQIGEILEYVEKLGELDVSSVEPLMHPFEHAPASSEAWREDKVVPCAPDPRGEGGYKVPRIL